MGGSSPRWTARDTWEMRLDGGIVAGPERPWEPQGRNPGPAGDGCRGLREQTVGPVAAAATLSSGFQKGGSESQTGKRGGAGQRKLPGVTQLERQEGQAGTVKPPLGHALWPWEERAGG